MTKRDNTIDVSAVQWNMIRDPEAGRWRFIACGDGGYPLIYQITRGHPGQRNTWDEYVCAKCATDIFNAEPETFDCEEARAIRAHVHWEGSPHQCDACSADIESAYGDPDEDPDEPAAEAS